MSPALTLIQADFSVTLAAARDAGGVDLILMSPPYCDARTYGAGVNWALPDYQRLGDAVKPALKPGGHCLMVLDAPVREWRKGYGTERGFMPWVVMLDWAERVGLRVPDRLAYGRHGQPGFFPGRFRNDWEPLLWFQRTGDAGFLDVRGIARVGLSGPRPRKTVAVRVGDKLVKQVRCGWANENGMELPGTLWDYGNTGTDGKDIAASHADHAARFYVGFAEDAVRCFCPPDGTVCDPFVGSGTSAVAARRHGRNFIGGDLLSRPADGMPWIEVTRRRVAGGEVVAPQRGDEGLPLFSPR